jgi:hypothetical protein
MLLSENPMTLGVNPMTLYNNSLFDIYGDEIAFRNLTILKVVPGVIHTLLDEALDIIATAEADMVSYEDHNKALDELETKLVDELDDVKAERDRLECLLDQLDDGGYRGLVDELKTELEAERRFRVEVQAQLIQLKAERAPKRRRRAA